RLGLCDGLGIVGAAAPRQNYRRCASRFWRHRRTALERKIRGGFSERKNAEHGFSGSGTNECAQQCSSAEIQRDEDRYGQGTAHVGPGEARVILNIPLLCRGGVDAPSEAKAQTG